MHAHTPPFTKPEAAYDSRRLYEETSAIAAEQDARHAMTDAERDAKLRTVAHYIYHAKLLMDEVFAEERARSDAALAELAREAQEMGAYAGADTPRKSPNADPAPKWSPKWLTDHGIPAESSYLASFSPNDMQAEVLRECRIGDVPPRHPMHAEAIRNHDDRLNGPEDVL